ncbi:MAG: sugar nucleotide-binding protein [Parvibaculum sp.]|uniref:SDR family oxidoreductase n=1 Tax=Parvibaculum sp. TaxID=2024848 RepID=UPI0032EB6BED
MKTLVLGSTGLLGQEMAREVRRRGHLLREAARCGATIALDIADDGALDAVLAAEAPDLVVNCAALTDIETCERDPLSAWRTNARPLAALALWSRRTGGRLIHISTDQYYSGGGAVAHDEKAPVSFFNEYARSKFAGEAFALTAANTLVLRTSIVGIRGWERPTFAEWAIDVAANDRPATVFSDAYTSSIDVIAFARAALDMVDARATGLFNLAAKEVYTKEDFVREIARQLGTPLTAATAGSVRTLDTRRADSLGLDVRRAETLLGNALPGLAQVVASVLRQYNETNRHELPDIASHRHA